MKKKNKISEGALDVGVQSYQTTSSNSSSTNGANINIKKKDLSDPSVQRNLTKMKGTNVNVVEETIEEVKKSLRYLSEVKDAETGEISKPFTINGKQYQMVRAISPTNEKVMGVCSLDETDENGDNIIYDVTEFEENIAKKAIGENDIDSDGIINQSEINTIDSPADEVNKQSKADEIGIGSFAGFKHYIVNRKTGKARKFKSIGDLAKANMSEDEQYMGIKDFKKYVDEVLFGSGKKQVKEVDTDVSTDSKTIVKTPTEQKMVASAEKLMKLIGEKIPSSVIEQIKTNNIAQREVLLAFAEMIGVPNSEINKVLLGIKNVSQHTNSVNEDIKNKSIIKVIKIKDIK